MNTRITRIGIVGSWPHVQRLMDEYATKHVDDDDRTYAQLLFSDFLKWAQEQESTVMKETNDGE